MGYENLTSPLGFKLSLFGNLRNLQPFVKLANESIQGEKQQLKKESSNMIREFPTRIIECDYLILIQTEQLTKNSKT